MAVAPVAVEDRPVVERLWQLYQHDLSEFRGTLPTGSATYKTARLEQYLTDDPDVAADLVRAGEAPAGFVLVRGTAGDLRVLGEFFVVRGVRRTGVGRAVAREVPDKPHLPPDVWISLETPA